MLANYLKVACKVLLRRKFFTFISLFGISLTLVVLLVAAALYDHIFSTQAPEVLGDRTLGIYSLAMVGPDVAFTGEAGYRFLDRYVRPLAQLPAVEAVTFFRGPSIAISYHEGRRIESMVKATDGEFWRVLKFEFLEGGAFTAQDDAEGRFVAVLSEATRDEFFGPGATALGRQIEIDGQRFRVAGVVKNVPYLRLAPYADVWVPIGTAKSDAYKQRLIGNFRALIVARSRADFPQIKAEVAAGLVAARSLFESKAYEQLLGGADTPLEAASRMLLTRRNEEAQPGLLLLIFGGLAFAFMLLPAVNLVNINLSRILDRSSEIGVRRAFGASSATLVGQFLVENLVLTLCGGAIGLVVGALVLEAINRSGLIAHAQLAINLRVFLYSLGAAIVFGLFSGVYPAWRMSRLHPALALKGKAS